MDEPKRCRFCGSGDIRHVYENDGLCGLFEYCQSCGVRTWPRVMQPSYLNHRGDETCIGKAMQLWNRRAK